MDAGNATNATIGGLDEGVTYFFAATAYLADGLESDQSAEVNYTVPFTTNGSPSIVLTSPANGATYTAPAIINLSADVAPNGHSISDVQFYQGAALLGDSTSMPYSFVWSNVGAGNYTIMAQAVYDAGTIVSSLPVDISVIGLAPPWQTADIGNVAVVGSAAESNGTYTVQGAGNLSGTADNFRFVFQPLSGDGEVSTCISSVDQTGTDGRIGVMIRESLTSGSKYAFMGISPDGAFLWQRRGSTDASTSSSSSGKGTLPNIWTRLTRKGRTFIGSQSIDGTNWTQVNSRNLTIATNVYAGLVVVSGSSNVLNTATFNNVNVIP